MTRVYPSGYALIVSPSSFGTVRRGSIQRNYGCGPSYPSTMTKSASKCPSILQHGRKHRLGVAEQSC